ncbi:MAG: CBS domain-containing protein [Planctomycetota bacterium]|jgi:acetoin utilization protein AcuB
MNDEQITLIDAIEEMGLKKNIGLDPMRVARDIMNSEVKTLTLDHTTRRCLELMASLNIRHVPVVDAPYEEEGKPCFIGIVSQRDVLRLNARETEETIEQPVDPKALRQLLIQIVARKPKAVSLQSSIPEVISVMINNHIDMVPVLDEGDLAGIITTTDIIKLFFRIEQAVQQLFPESQNDTSIIDTTSEGSFEAAVLFPWCFRTIQEVMTKEVICLEPQDDIAKAIKVLQTEKFRHVPIVDVEGKLAGLVSDRDILRNLPFAGKRPPCPPKIFREHLFAVDPWDERHLQPLESIMVRRIFHISPCTRICDAAEILYREKISCLPVVNERGKVQGIITVTDLMRALLLAYDPPEKSDLIADESNIC